MGDDSEADAVAYTLYHRFTSKQLDGGGAGRGRLDAVPVDATWRPAIVDLARRVAPVLPASAARRRHLHQPDRHAERALPGGQLDGAGLTRYHTGAWPLALDLFEEGRLSGPATAAVKARLMELGQTTAMLSMAAARTP